MADKHKRRTGCLVFLSATCLICMSTLFVEAQTKLLRRFFDDVVLDNKNHYLPCHQLPTVDEVKRVVAEHQDVIDQIKKAGGDIRIEGYTCPGGTEVRGDILIWYPAHKNRVAIEGIINGETFFGIPYRLLNN